MKIKEYAEKISALAEAYPDATVVYAKDDEGNAFFPVEYHPVEGQYNDGEFHAMDEDEDFLGHNKVTHICIN